jgi:hypothetical protein
MLFQLKKSFLYFDDAQRDLNVNRYSGKSGRFERLSDAGYLRNVILKIRVKRAKEKRLKRKKMTLTPNFPNFPTIFPYGE